MYKSTKGVDEAAVKETLKRYTGVISQIPPMYSALKKNGYPYISLQEKA